MNIIQRFRYGLTLLSVLTLTAAQETAAQEMKPAADAPDSLLLRDYRYVSTQDVWVGAANASGLTRFAAPNIATAQLSVQLSGGSLRNYSDARHVVEWQAGAQALHRLSRSTVVYGAIGYNNFSGSNMTGSVFIDPSRKPFDIMEYTADNAGDKHRDTYHLTGAVATDVWRGYAVGVSIDYTSANYAKYKDLRHKNKLMDLNVSGGVYAPVLPWLQLGAHYAYHRNTESLDFSVNGKNEVVYKSLISYAACFGMVEQYGNDGYTDQAREMPLFEDGHAWSVQAGVSPHSSLSMLASYTYATGSGYYGRKSPYTITYTEHERRKHQASAALVYQAADSRHRLDVAYTLEKLSSKAETVRGQKNESGATYYEYYDPVETADKQWRDVTVAYSADVQVRGETPVWHFGVNYAWHQRKQAAYLYPFYRHQQLHTNRIAVEAEHNLLARKGIYTFALGIGYQKGHGYPARDYTFITPSDRQESPATMDEALYAEYAFLAARQWHFQGRVQYAFVFPGTRLKTHAALSFEYRTASALDLIGSRHRGLGMLAVGCTF